MNRQDELLELLKELEEPVEGLEGTLTRAKRRRIKKRRMMGSFATVAAVLVLFVGLVNFSTPVAYACSKIPIIKELAEAVTFSRSLSDALDNEYVQPMNLHKEDGGVTATVEYLIVDQKQVNVFFRLDSEYYKGLSTDPEVRAADGMSPMPCAYSISEFGVENGELRCLTIDFVDEDVPEALRIVMDIRDTGDPLAVDAPAAPESVTNSMFAEHEEMVEYVAYFEFLIEFDPTFTAQARVFDIGETVIMGGQKITITNMEVYPTHLRVNIAEDEENTAWLKSLFFYVETDWGMKFETIYNGISATGAGDSKSMVSFRADSSYFYEAKHLKIVITGAELLNKDMEKVYVNLRTGEAESLPENVRLVSADKQSEGWIVSMEADYRKENHMHQLFSNVFYGENGEKYEISCWSTTMGDANEEGKITTFVQEFPLKGYQEDEVWLCPHYSHVWSAEEPLEIVVQ